MRTYIEVMQGRKPKRKVYEFLDYREYLQAYFNTAKENNHRFSLRTFSDVLGFKSKDFIHRVMKGEKNLSPGSITLVCQGLALNPRESYFFESLVHFCQAETQDDRQKYYERLQTQLKGIRFRESQQLLCYTQYEYYSQWQHCAVRSYIGMHGFSGDYKTLANQLLPAISVEEARRSVAILSQLGLIAKKNNQWHITRTAISSGDRVAKLALKNFHNQCLQLAADSMDTVPPNERNISGVTLGISREKYDLIVERLNAFRKEIAMLTEEDPEAFQVYQLNLQLFPLSRNSSPNS